MPHLHRDRAHRSHICTWTWLTPATSAPGLGCLQTLKALGAATDDKKVRKPRRRRARALRSASKSELINVTRIVRTRCSIAATIRARLLPHRSGFSLTVGGAPAATAATAPCPERLAGRMRGCVHRWRRVVPEGTRGTQSARTCPNCARVVLARARPQTNAHTHAHARAGAHTRIC